MYLDFSRIFSCVSVGMCECMCVCVCVYLYVYNFGNVTAVLSTVCGDKQARLCLCVCVCVQISHCC